MCVMNPKNLPPHFFCYKSVTMARKETLQNYREFICVVFKKIASKVLIFLIIL